MNGQNADVLLVYLPVIFGQGKSYGLPPNGVFSLASSLQDAGISSRVLDASIKGLSLEQILDVVADVNPKLVGLSALTPHLPNLKALTAALNEKGYRGKIICGGPHFNNTREESGHFADIDYIMYGECELSFPEFCREFLAGRSVENCTNLIYRNAKGEFVTNPPAPVIEDLDTLPFVDLSLGDPYDYATMYGRSDHTTSLMASRGCPYLCTFCDVFSIWGRKIRFRTPENVMDEIEFNLEHFGINEFVFKDSTFTLNYKWLDSLLTEMEKRKLDITWICNTRVDRVNRDMLLRMKKCGLTTISYGVESGSQKILDGVKKRITVAQIEEAFKETNNAGLAAGAYFMIGNPGETKEMAQESLDLALRLPATFTDVSVTVAYPGTELYETAVKEGYLKDPKWYLQDKDVSGVFLMGEAKAGPGNLCLPNFLPEEQYAFSKIFWRRVYLRPITFYRFFIRNASARLFWRALKILPGFLVYIFSPQAKALSNDTHNAKGEHLPIK